MLRLPSGLALAGDHQRMFYAVMLAPVNKPHQLNQRIIAGFTMQIKPGTDCDTPTPQAPLAAPVKTGLWLWWWWRLGGSVRYMPG